MQYEAKELNVENFHDRRNNDLEETSWEEKEDTSPGLYVWYMACEKVFSYWKGLQGMLYQGKTISLKEHVKGKFSNEFERKWGIWWADNPENKVGEGAGRENNSAPLVN